MEFEEVEQVMEEEYEEMEEINDIPSLLKELLIAEQEYRQSKLEYKQGFNRKQITLNWDLINEERKAEGLPKLGSKEMREALIKELLKEDEIAYTEARIHYHKLYRMYEMALKYSFEVLR